MARKSPTARRRAAAPAPKSQRLPRIAPPKMAVPRVALPRVAKGRRPEFYDDPAIDQLFAIATALTGEVSVLFDRLDTLERLLGKGGVLAADAIEAYVPDAAAASVRAERRNELLRRVFAVLELYAARKAAPGS